MFKVGGSCHDCKDRDRVRCRQVDVHCLRLAESQCICVLRIDKREAHLCWTISIFTLDGVRVSTRHYRSAPENSLRKRSLTLPRGNQRWLCRKPWRCMVSPDVAWSDPAFVPPGCAGAASRRMVLLDVTVPRDAPVDCCLTGGMCMIPCFVFGAPERLLVSAMDSAVFRNRLP